TQSAPLKAVAAAPALAEAARRTAAADATQGDESPAEAAPLEPSAPAQWRPAAHWKLLAAMLLLMLVSQAGTIAWLTLSDRAPPRVAPAPSAAPAPAPASAPAVATPSPIVVRSLAA